jgi:hypothetical protein
MPNPGSHGYDVKRTRLRAGLTTTAHRTSTPTMP